jgi:hypothetical protein
MRSLEAFEDLSVEDKAKVIGGLIAVGVATLGFVIFIQLFGAEYSLRVSEDVKSGSSMFTAMSSFIVVMYFFTIFPTVVVGAVAMSLLAKHSLGYMVKDILFLLLVTGGTFFLIALLLGLFGVFFSNLSEDAQVILTMFACFVPSITVGLFILKTKRLSGYFWKSTV